MEINLDDFKKEPKYFGNKSCIVHKGADPEQEFDYDFISDCWSNYELKIMRSKIRKCVCSICMNVSMINEYERNKHCFKLHPNIEEERYVFICKNCNIEGWRDILKRKRKIRVKVGIMGMNQQEF